jgi:hypothetical protein
VAEDPDLPPGRRAELMERLTAAVPEELGWLRDHGYGQAEARWPAVRLQSPSVTLAIGYSATHGGAPTLGVSLQEHDDLQARSLSALQRLSGVPEHPPRDWLIESDDDVRRALARISQALETVEPLVAGDAGAFRAVRRREKEAVTANALDYALDDARRDAGEAWQAKDLDRVVEILEPLEGHLERHEQGWLDYARRRRA